MPESTKSRKLVSRSGIGGLAELALIERISRTQGGTSRAVRIGIGDDCAVLRVKPGEEMVVTTDLFLEGRHFRRDWHSAESAGHRCLARGLSDVAAMGARPVAAFLSLALPRDYPVRWVDGFLRGFQTLAKRFGVQLAGGDTAQASGEQVLADIVLVGAVARGRALLRSGARPGDGIYVSGTLGGAAVELRQIAQGAKSPVKGSSGHPQTFPEPRIALGHAIVRRRLASACMDLSDGLSSDLAHLCRASGVGARIESAALPLAAKASVDEAVNGGEDYELLFTAAGKIPRTLAGTAITRIGSVQAGRTVMLDGEGLRPGGWEHFRQ
jgi:thiamine-monophosphate kinase